MEQVCPVCQGRGTVDPGFYLASPGQVITLANPAREDCRRCNGRGTITTASAEPQMTVRSRAMRAVSEPHEP